MNTIELDFQKEVLECPCQFTIEELHREIELAEDDIKNGRVYTMEEMRTMYPRL
jgi:hypothetical protein